jgi:nitroimidazol reductase NimA-like FMN-containing flavoprotein (pyridoxamine 5'-phosphate oxidase superfamily)
MPREHATITLTPDEIVAFVSTQTHCFLATLDPDGSPWGDVAACVYRDGRLWFRLAAGSRSLRNVKADPRVCCTLEAEGSNYYDNISAMVHGEASSSEDGGSLAELDEVSDPVTGTRTTGPVFSVDLEHVVSFDFAKIQRRFAQS